MIIQIQPFIPLFMVDYTKISRLKKPRQKGTKEK